MDCPKCKSRSLRATKIEQGLSAMGCADCGGALVSLLYYRDWAERTPLQPSDVITDIEDPQQDTISEDVSVNDTSAALACPKCKKLMTKFKVSGCTSNRLDLCTSCDEAWLDGGEWELLKSLELSRKMPAVFTEQWQRKVRQQELDSAREQRLLQVVSEEDLFIVKQFREWVKGHPQREKIIFFVNHS